MRNLLLSLTVLLVLFTSATSRRFRSQDDALEYTADFNGIIRIKSTDLSKLSPGEYYIMFEDACPDNPLFENLDRPFFIYLPPDFMNTSKPAGIHGFIHPSERWGMWEPYKTVFNEYNMIHFVPQNAGNSRDDATRIAMISAGISYLKNGISNINASRVYASGLSGGGQIACHIGFDYATQIHGIIANCGCDYFRKITLSSGSDTTYGYYQAFPVPLEAMQTYLRVVIITGSKDFLHSNLVDIYTNGIQQDNITGMLFDIEGMSHQMADATTLASAIAFLDSSVTTCEYPCKTCSSSNGNDCTSCFSYMSYYYNYTSETGTCVDACPSGWVQTTNDAGDSICSKSEESEESSED